MIVKKCKKCGKKFEVNNEEELKKHFYFKSGYFRGVCKECEKQEHKDNYKSGKWNYHGKNSKK